jgi:hypothetical protein
VGAIMSNETKPDIEIVKTEDKSSNTRALVIIGVFVAFFIGMIVFEIASKK